MTILQLKRAAQYQQQLIDTTGQQAELLDLAALNQATAEERQAVQNTADQLRRQAQRLICELHDLQARLEKAEGKHTAEPEPAVFALSDEALPAESAHLWGAIAERASIAA